MLHYKQNWFLTVHCRYGSELMVVESYSENNMSANMIGRHLDHYWLGLASLDDLRTNTLESAAGMLVSQYAGSYAPVSASFDLQITAAHSARAHPVTERILCCFSHLPSFLYLSLERDSRSSPLTIDCLKDLDRYSPWCDAVSKCSFQSKGNKNFLKLQMLRDA